MKPWPRTTQAARPGVIRGRRQRKVLGDQSAGLIVEIPFRRKFSRSAGSSSGCIGLGLGQLAS